MVPLVFGIALIAFGPSLGGRLLWDDPAHVTIPDLQSWSGLWRILTRIGTTQEYYPFLHGAFWVEHRIWGDNLPLYHLLNICLHAGSACLLALLLRRIWTRPTVLAGTEARLMPAGAEWFAALLFAVHPVTVESVAWITEQKNTLSVFFYLLAALLYLRFDDERRGRDYALALGAFFVALGAKTATITLPAALLVVVWWRNGRVQWRRDVIPLLPWFALALAAGLVTVQVETNYVGAKGAAYALTFGERLMLAPRIVWFYIEKDLWPRDLLFFYPRWNVPAEAWSWWAYALATIAVTLVLAAWAFARQVRGPLAAWLLFLGAMFPVIGFFNVFAFVFSYVADHFQYMPCLTFVAAATTAVACVISRFPARSVRLTAVVAGLVVVSFAVQTHRLSALYQNNETLFGHVAAQNPDAWMAHQVLATTYAKSGRSAEAMAQYREVIRINPAYPDAYHGLAIEIGKDPARRAESLALYEKSLALRPHYLEAHYNYGLALAMDPARRGEAIEHLKVATGLKPSFTEAQVALANLLAKDRATLPEALEHLETALRFTPKSGAIHRDYGDVLARAGRLPDAVQEYETALRLNEQDAEAHFHLADVLASRPGRAAEALPHYESALRLNPKLVEAHAHLAGVLAGQGRLDEAVTHVEAALKLKPDDVEGHNMLAILCAQKGDLQRARDEWQKALAINPGYEDARQNLRRLEVMLQQQRK